ncbi:putative gustatory receptor 22d [Drosophila santomea]|uniref:putative gustatory receptor 22d n=1 Tax=Drosophila santomea TaxID=129105 RepID=UPI0019548B3F|nr:putative gustatory receptor 22d [Drosophila santomea]
MFRPRCGLRPKFVYVVLKSILYSSWLLGIFPFKYDPKLRRLRRSKWLILFGLAMTSSPLILMLKQSAEYHEHGIRLDVFQRNSVLHQIISIMEVVGVVTICTVYLRTLWRSKHLEEIYNGLMLLKANYFCSDAVECPAFDVYVIQKGVLIVVGLLAPWIVHFGTPNINVPVMNVLVVSLGKLGTLLLAVHYHLGLAFIYRFVWLINRELLILVSSLRGNQMGSSSRVRFLLKLYTKLVQLYSRLADCYDYQTVLMMAVFLSANIIVCFYMIVYRISLGKMSFFVMLIMFPLALANNFLDFWLIMKVCDLLQKTGSQTSMILKLFNDIESMDKDLERSINDFALYCSHQRFKFLHCGLFYVNREMGFNMFVASFLYLLYLVQFDFMNL